MASNIYYGNCAICGDIAKGYNYTVPSCESCKLFYNRNAKMNNKEYNCKSGGNCKIDLITRKHCKSCRLKKCFAVGMERIRPKNVDKQKEINKYENISPMLDLVEGCDESDIISDILENNDFNEHELNEEIMEIKNYIKVKTKPDNCEVDKTNQDNFATIVPLYRPVMHNRSNLNELEKNKLTELITSLNFLNPDFNHQDDSVNADIWLVIKRSFIKFDENARKLIKISKSLSSFEEICKDDQYYILKNHAFDVSQLCKLRQYNYQHNSLLLFTELQRNELNHMNLRAETLKQFSCLYNWYFKSIIPEVESDTVILDLVTAIALFNPDTPCLINRPCVKYQQLLYIHLLQRYLQIRCQSESDSQIRFSKLMKTIEELNKLCHFGRQFIHTHFVALKQFLTPLVMELLI